MNEPTPSVVDSWEQLRERIASIVGELNRNQALALAAAANPFFALEELGIEVTPDARVVIGDRLRFAPDVTIRRAKLRADISVIAERPIDPDSSELLQELLFGQLQLTPYPDRYGCYPQQPDTRPPRKTSDRTAEPDPLSSLEGRHPIIGLLLEYRQLGATRAPFAERSAWEAIRSGAINTGLQKLNIRFKAENPTGGARNNASGKSGMESRKKR
ncbi:MAG: hypothetical protein H7Z40_00465 [Phycisphaerae bacterium]|nr:hypothetical protein [Gemmatimonadaceae bacterium]